MERITAGTLKGIVSGLDDDVEINLLIDITRIDGRHITREAKVESVEATIGQGTLFEWVDVTLSADLAPADLGWALIEDGKITEEEYWRLVAK